MDEGELTVCDECGSDFFKSASKMSAVCPECVHILYSYENCAHAFKNGRCVHCNWDGSRSEYIMRLIKDN